VSNSYMYTGMCL